MPGNRPTNRTRSGFYLLSPHGLMESITIILGMKIFLIQHEPKSNCMPSFISLKKSMPISAMLIILHFAQAKAFTTVTPPKEEQPPKTILLILDGLAVGAIDRIPLPNLQKLKKRGCYYQAVHLPLPAHPPRSSTYPWSCSLPNPALMSGTVFIGQEGIRQQLIQHQLSAQKTAFIVNDGAYKDVAGGFDIYLNLRQTFDDLFRDELVIEKTKSILKEEDPDFLRVHLQGPGSAGHRSNEAANADEPWHHNIWHPQSPYIRQLQKANRLVADFVQWLTQEGYLEHTVLFILGDHGQAPTGAHPPFHPASNKTEMLVLGQEVKAGKEYAYAEITDMAPTITHRHGTVPPKYANGRILKEAFTSGPDTIPSIRHIQALNNLLLAAHERQELGLSLPAAFKGILDISTWHVGIAPLTLENFIARQSAQLD